VSSSVATYDISKTDFPTLTLVQAETYHLAKEAIHPVGELEQSMPDFAITDPSGKFLLVPDPGADLVRIYLLNEDGRLRFTALSPLVVAGGPRYADFLVALDGTVYLYVTTANTNMIKGYKVVYTSGNTWSLRRCRRVRRRRMCTMWAVMYIFLCVSASSRWWLSTRGDISLTIHLL